MSSSTFYWWEASLASKAVYVTELNSSSSLTTTVNCPRSEAPYVRGPHHYHCVWSTWVLTISHHFYPYLLFQVIFMKMTVTSFWLVLWLHLHPYSPLSSEIPEQSLQSLITPQLKTLQWLHPTPKQIQSLHHGPRGPSDLTPGHSSPCPTPTSLDSLLFSCAASTFICWDWSSSKYSNGSPSLTFFQLMIRSYEKNPCLSS